MRVKKAVQPGKGNACVQGPLYILSSSYWNIEGFYKKVKF